MVLTTKRNTADIVIKAMPIENENKDNTILIPVNKTIMIENLDYFKCMFQEGSNWAENSKTKDSRIVEMRVPNPSIFAEYLGSICEKPIDINPENCAAIFEVCDMIQDTKLLPEIEKYVKENLNYENIVDLYNKSDRFKDEIEKYVSNNRIESINEFKKSVSKLSIDKFIKLMNHIGGNINSSAFIDVQIEWISKSTKTSEIIKRIILESDYQKVNHIDRHELFNYVMKKIDNNVVTDMYEHIFRNVQDTEARNEKTRSSLIKFISRVEETCGKETISKVLTNQILVRFLESSEYTRLTTISKIFTELVKSLENTEFPMVKEFTKACDENNIDTVSHMINGSDKVKKRIKFKDLSDDCSELVDATKNENYELIELLLANGADINAREKHVKTPIRSINGEQCYVVNPIIYACFAGNLESVKFLVDHGCRLDKLYSYSSIQQDALHTAADGKSKNIIDYLIKLRDDWSFENISKEYYVEQDMIDYINEKRLEKSK